MVSVTPRPHFTPGKDDPVPIVQEAGWASGPVWTDGKSRPLTRDFFYLKTCTLLFFEVYIIVPLYTCFVLFLVVVSNEFSGREWGLGCSLGLPLDICVCVCTVCCLVGGVDFFSIFAVSCHLVVWLSSVDCSSCVFVRLCQDISNTVLSGRF